ncbi:MAG: glycosyltransferase family 2 protein [Candidatus Aminicenantes bacterium]|nr:glycosyltransferase family 2 protein [Candidatus Aminicenantes bacterium]
MDVLLHPSFWWAAGSVTLAVWLAIAAAAAYNLHHIPWLFPSEPLQVNDALISVIIPVRNEERDVAVALRSVLAQEGVRLEIIVVNDHSNDRSAAILDDVAGSDRRLRVIHNPPLLPGWLGKANAMRAGLEAATGDYVLFTDADVIHAPRCFASALAEMGNRQYDLISCLPLIRVRLFWEYAMLPMSVSALAKLVPEKRQQDRHVPDAAASGSLILLKREVLRRLGGLDPIKGSLADDMTLARAAKRHGFATGYRFAPELMSMQLYKRNREAFISSSKNILIVIEESIWLAPAVPLFTFMLSWSPWIMFILGCWRGDASLALAGLACYGAAYASLFVSRRIFAFRPLPALVFPLTFFIVSYCISRAFMLHLRGSIEWRGRVIRVR